MAHYLVEHALPAELSALVNARAGDGWTLVSVESVVTEWHCVTSRHGYERREAMKIMQTVVFSRVPEAEPATAGPPRTVITPGVRERLRSGGSGVRPPS